MFDKRKPVPPIVAEVAGKLDEFNRIPKQVALAERLHADQVKDREAIIAIQKRMAERREQMAFLEDHPGAEAIFHALARFLNPTEGVK